MTLLPNEGSLFCLVSLRVERQFHKDFECISCKISKIDTCPYDGLVFWASETLESFGEAGL